MVKFVGSVKKELVEVQGLKEFETQNIPWNINFKSKQLNVIPIIYNLIVHIENN